DTGSVFIGFVVFRRGFHRPAKYKYGDVVTDIQDLGGVSTDLALQNASGIDGNVCFTLCHS
ncbi:hypothetical protein ACR2U3_27770, partial [Klebsiella pneumoniae]